MALTIANRRYHSVGNRRARSLDVTFDSSYATGGEELKLATLGLKSVDHVSVEGSSGHLFAYDRTNEKLKAFLFDYDAVADGPAIEVGSGTNLSAVTVKLFAIGV